MKYSINSNDWKSVLDIPDEELLDALICDCKCGEPHSQFGLMNVYSEVLKRMKLGSGNKTL